MTEVREEVKHEPTEAKNPTIVDKVRQALGPYNYDPEPSQENKNRVFKKEKLATGAEYEG